LKALSELLVANGVRSVKSNTVTGSTVVEYDPDIITSRHLMGILRDNGYAIEARPAGATPGVRLNGEEMALKVGKAALSWLAGLVLEANGLGFIAVFI
jgi:hypothetical protein